MKRFGSAAAAALLMVSPAAAQISIDSGMGPMFDGANAMSGTILQQQTLKNILGSNARASAARRPAMPAPRIAPGAPTLRPTAAPVAGRAIATTYRASPAVSQRVKGQFADHFTRTVSPEAGTQVRALLQRSDPVRNWSQLVASDGLRAGDVADAFAAYWILNWMIANQGDNNRAQTLAVRDQVRGIMASNPSIAGLNEAQRQEMAEVLMLNFLVQHAAYTEAMKRGDRALIGRLGQAAVTRFQNEMGVDLRSLQLTDAGLIRRG